MTSDVSTQPAPHPVTRSASWRFLAGGVMLAVMAWWISVNHDPAPTVPAAVIGLGGLVALLWGMIQLFRDRAVSGTAESQRVSALLALVGSVGVGAVAFWLALTLGREALGEVLGLAFFSLLALGTGCGLTTGDGTEAGWNRVRSFLPLMKFLLLFVGITLLGTFIYFAMVREGGREYAAELLGSLITGFLLTFAGVWLLSTPQPETGTLRLFFIILGACLGTTLTIISLARGFLWSETIFHGGIAAWSGADAWRFWLVAYLFLGGLGLIFASLGLSVSQVRSSAALRQTLFGYVSVFSVVFLLVLLGMLNILVYLKVPYTFNWSKTRGLAALSPGTKNLLAGLEKTTHFYVLIPQNHPIYSDLKNLLDNSQAYSNKIAVKYIDPDRDIAKYTELANRFKEILPDARVVARDEESGRGVLLVYGDLPKEVAEPVPHSFVPERRLYGQDVDRKGDRGKLTLTFKAEAELMRELDFLAQKKEKRKLYFLQGDDELDLATTEPSRPRLNPSFELASQGAGKLAELFKKANFDIKGISFRPSPADDKTKDILYLGDGSADKKAEVPEDCHTLFVAGPGVPLSPAALDALERYMDRGGRMIVMLDLAAERGLTSMRETGIEGLLKKYGVIATNEFVVRAPIPSQNDFNLFGPRRMSDPRVVLAQSPAKPATVLAKQFVGTPFHLWNPRVVKPGESTRYKVEPLLVVNSALISSQGSFVWADDSPKMFGDFERYFRDRLAGKPAAAVLAREPLPVAVTVTEGSGDSVKPRMVVFGDSEFLANGELTQVETNFDLAASAVEWMSERGFVGPRPKETSSFSFPPGVDFGSMFWGAHWTMTMLLLVLGVCTWLVRRR